MGHVILVRHGEADGNQLHRLIGWADVALTARGRAQAEALADRLAAQPIARLVSSDLRRATETATPLAGRIGLPVETDRRLREIHNGEWTGLTPTEIGDRWAETWARYVGGVDVARPGGERWADVRSRVVEAILELLEGDGLTVVVSHGGPLLLTAAWASGVSLPGNIFNGPLAPADNAALCTVVPGPRLLGYNDVGHLSGLATLDVPYAPVDG